MNRLKIVLTCPNCGNSTWLRTNDKEVHFECLACGDHYNTEDMCSRAEVYQHESVSVTNKAPVAPAKTETKSPKYTSFDELHKAYGMFETNKTREDMSEEEESRFIEDCFDLYEYIGFSDTYESPYEEYEHLNGKHFTVLGRLTETCDSCVLPMWKIRIVSGDDEEAVIEEFGAYPEEICRAEHKEMSNSPIFSTTFFKGNIVIVTESVDGEIYCIEADEVVDLINDWNDECLVVPANDAKVFFASINGKPINPYLFTDFESLMGYLCDLKKVKCFN